MNKLMMIALVLGFSVVANVEAARGGKRTAPKVEAPVEAPKVEAPKAEAPKVEAPKAEAPKAPVKEVFPDRDFTVEELEQLEEMMQDEHGTFLQKTKGKIKAAGRWTKGQFVDHTGRSVAISASTAVVLALVIDAGVRGKRSLLGKLVQKFSKKGANYAQLDALKAAKEAAQAA